MHVAHTLLVTSALVLHAGECKRAGRAEVRGDFSRDELAVDQQRGILRPVIGEVWRAGDPSRVTFGEQYSLGS